MTVLPESNSDKPVKSRKTPVFVFPVKTGIQETHSLVDSRFRESLFLRESYFGRDASATIEIPVTRRSIPTSKPTAHIPDSGH
jgi:hypothetical protein